MQQNDAVYVDEYEARAWQEDHRQPYKHDEYLGIYADAEGTKADSCNLISGNGPSRG